MPMVMNMMMMMMMMTRGGDGDSGGGGDLNSFLLSILFTMLAASILHP